MTQLEENYYAIEQATFDKGKAGTWLTGGGYPIIRYNLEEATTKYDEYKKFGPCRLVEVEIKRKVIITNETE